MDAQADLSLYCAYISESIFCHIVAHPSDYFQDYMVLVAQLEQQLRLVNIFSLPFHLKFLKWTLPSLNAWIVENRDISHK